MAQARAKQSFSLGRRIVHRGDLVDTDSPTYIGREHLFDEPTGPAKRARKKPADDAESGD